MTKRRVDAALADKVRTRCLFFFVFASKPYTLFQILYTSPRPMPLVDGSLVRAPACVAFLPLFPSKRGMWIMERRLPTGCHPRSLVAKDRLWSWGSRSPVLGAGTICRSLRSTSQYPRAPSPSPLPRVGALGGSGLAPLPVLGPVSNVVSCWGKAWLDAALTVDVG